MQSIYATMQQRNAPSGTWIDENPVLQKGELGFETNTGRYKLGDGVKSWVDLPYVTNEDLILYSYNCSPSVQTEWQYRLAHLQDEVIMKEQDLPDDYEYDEDSTIRTKNDFIHFENQLKSELLAHTNLTLLYACILANYGYDDINHGRIEKFGLKGLNDYKTKISKELYEISLPNELKIDDITYTDFGPIQEFINILIKWIGDLYNDPSVCFEQLGSVLYRYCNSNNVNHYWALIQEVFKVLNIKLQADNIYKSDLQHIFNDIISYPEVGQTITYEDISQFFEKINFWLDYIYHIRQILHTASIAQVVINFNFNKTINGIIIGRGVPELGVNDYVVYNAPQVFYHNTTYEVVVPSYDQLYPAFKNQRINASGETTSITEDISKYLILPNEMLEVYTPDYNDVQDFRALIELVEGQTLYYGVVQDLTEFTALPLGHQSKMFDKNVPVHIDLFCDTNKYGYWIVPYDSTKIGADEVSINKHFSINGFEGGYTVQQNKITIHNRNYEVFITERPGFGKIRVLGRKLYAFNE